MTRQDVDEAYDRNLQGKRYFAVLRFGVAKDFRIIFFVGDLEFMFPV
jgi:hypothetical protein